MIAWPTIVKRQLHRIFYRLVFFNQPRLKTTVTVTRSLQLKFAIFGFHVLCGFARKGFDVFFFMLFTLSFWVNDKQLHKIIYSH